MNIRVFANTDFDCDKCDCGYSAAMGYLHYSLLQREMNDRRYRHNNVIHDVDRILFCFLGDLLAELIVEKTVAPTDDDRESWPKTRLVYIVSEVRIFGDRTTRQKDYGLKNSQGGTIVPEDVYHKIIAKVGIEETLTWTPSGVVRS